MAGNAAGSQEGRPTEGRPTPDRPTEGRPPLAPPLRNLPGMVCRTRVDQDRTIEFVSEGCRDITGYDARDLVHNRTVAYGDLIYSRDQEMVREAIAAALRERRHFQISYRIQTQSGQEKWVWEQGEGVFVANGHYEPVAVESIVVDITPRRAATQQIETQDRLATVGRLATGIAHDFNNIMSIIVLYSDLLARQPEHPRRNQYLSVITKQANHASRLIGQLLDYSRNSFVDEHILDLHAFLQETVDLLERTLPEQIQVSFLPSDIEEALVRADPTRLQQVMINLALNARDAMPRGGHLTIRLSPLRLLPGQTPPVAGMAAGRWLRIDVADEGVGIPSDVLPHIFEPFYTTKDVGQGTGLGLAQVEGIVEQLGGAVGVESQPGAGTTFSVYLPLVNAGERARSGADRRAAPARRGETVLIVEDNPETREAVVEATRGLGYHVLVATRGQEALHLFQAQGELIDLLVTDAVMPDIDGIELCRLLHDQRPDLPCLVMSGYNLSLERQRLLEEQNALWIQKPFTLEALADTMRTALRTQ